MNGKKFSLGPVAIIEQTFITRLIIRTEDPTAAPPTEVVVNGIHYIRADQEKS